MDDVNSPAIVKTKVGGLDGNLAAAACWLPLGSLNIIASLVFFFTEPPESKLVRFHAVQSLMFQVAVIGASFMFGVVIAVLQVGAIFIDDSGTLVAISGLITVLLAFALVFAILGTSLLCMYKAFKGQIFRVPIIGQIADRITG